MATTNKNYNYSRRACTEVPDRDNGGEEYDINNLPDKEGEKVAVAEDVDDIDY